MEANIYEKLRTKVNIPYPLCGLNSEGMFQPVNISVV